jgi:hypothetical protein
LFETRRYTVYSGSAVSDDRLWCLLQIFPKLLFLLIFYQLLNLIPVIHSDSFHPQENDNLYKFVRQDPLKFGHG